MDKFIRLIKGQTFGIRLPIECAVRLDDDFLAIEFADNWVQHAKSCEDCKQFLDDLFFSDNAWKYKSIENWVLKHNNEYFQIMYNLLSSKNSHFDNSFTITNSCYTECKLKIKKFQPSNKIIQYFERLENYEICSLILNQKEFEDDK